MALRILLGNQDDQRIPLERQFQGSSFTSLQARDRRLTTELVYGVLRNRSLLDFQLDSLLDRPRSSLDPEVLEIIRIGLFQLSFLRIPNWAAVHETVQLCKDMRKFSASALVNAILRRFLQVSPSLPDEDNAESLAIRYSHPEWLVHRYISRYGLRGTQQILERNNQPPQLYLWTNLFKMTFEDLCWELEREGVSFQLHPSLPNCLIVRSNSFVQHRLYREGYCFLMDAASQEVAHLGDLRQCRVLGDFCAAPGGKSFLLSLRKPANAHLYSCDISFSRLNQLRQRANLYQIPHIRLVQADLNNSPLKPHFDFILLDVPCTGTATLRSNPDIRWRLNEHDLNRLSGIQLSLLRNSFQLLREGGQLIYATCSTEPEENEDVVEDFLSGEPGAQLRGFPLSTFLERESFFAASLVRPFKGK